MGLWHIEFNVTAKGSRNRVAQAWFGPACDLILDEW